MHTLDTLLADCVGRYIQTQGGKTQVCSLATFFLFDVPGLLILFFLPATK